MEKESCNAGSIKSAYGAIKAASWSLADRNDGNEEE